MNRKVYNEIRDTVLDLIAELCTESDIELKYDTGVIGNYERAPSIRFVTTGKRGGSPGITLTAYDVYCWDEHFTLGRSHGHSSYKFELADPQFPDTVLEHLKKVLRIQ